MQLHIRHETVYRYGESVKRSVQNLRLTPRRDPVQRALNWNIVAPGRQNEQIDAYGNVVHLLTLDEPHREIRIIVNGVVETDDHEGQALPNEGKLSPLTYLADTPLTRADASIHAFASDYLPRSGERRAALMRLAEAISDTVKYEQGATDVWESASKAFARGKGVCQDHAHVFISAVRSLGLPARYVSGYLFSGGDEPSEANHAWAEVWIEDLGWVGFDPANGICPTDSYVRLAAGLDATFAAPIRGMRHGIANEELDVIVEVQQQISQQQ